MTTSNAIAPDEIRHQVIINNAGVDIDALQRRSICLIGPSGVGKSTVAETIEERTGRRWLVPPSVVTEPRSLRCTNICTCRPISCDVFDHLEENRQLFLIQRSPVGNVGIETKCINELISTGTGIVFILRTHGGIRRFLPNLAIIDMRAPLDVLEKRIWIRSQWRPLLTSLPILLDVCAKDMDDNEKERQASSVDRFGAWTVVDNGAEQAPIAECVVDRVLKILGIKGEEE